MLFQLSAFSQTINGRPYTFLCDPQSPIADVKEALFQIMKEVSKIEDEIKAQAEAKQKEEAEREPPEEKLITIGED